MIEEYFVTVFIASLFHRFYPIHHIYWLLRAPSPIHPPPNPTHPTPSTSLPPPNSTCLPCLFSVHPAHPYAKLSRKNIFKKNHFWFAPNTKIGLTDTLHYRLRWPFGVLEHRKKSAIADAQFNPHSQENGSIDTDLTQILHRKKYLPNRICQGIGRKKLKRWKEASVKADFLCWGLV